MKLALVNVFKNPGSPPMGLVYIATYLKEYSNFDDIRIIDANLHDIWHELKKYKPDLIGISAMTVGYSRANKLADRIKQGLTDSQRGLKFHSKLLRNRMTA